MSFWSDLLAATPSAILIHPASVISSLTARLQNKGGAGTKKMIRLFLSTPQGDKNKLHITGPQNGGSAYLMFWSDVFVNRACPMASPAAPDSLQLSKLWRERT